MTITANEFDASYPGNTRWDETIEAIDYGFYDLHWDCLSENKKSVINEISGVESEINDFLCIYD